MKVCAIVVAAGSGTRMKSDIKKPFIEVAGLPVIVRTLQSLEQSPLVTDIAVVVSEQDLNHMKRIASQFGMRKVNRYVPGGDNRQQSVHNGLAAIDQCDIVVVHDGVRPFVTADELQRVIHAAAETGAATMGTPVKDTIKQIEDGVVKQTVPRHSLYAVQTPQAFRFAVLLEAHEKAEASNFTATDDASLAEMAGYPVRVVEGSYRNIKLTTPEDLLIAKAFISQQL